MNTIPAYYQEFCDKIAVDVRRVQAAAALPEYIGFKIPKKRGGYRTILKPNDELLYVQKRLMMYLTSFYTPPQAVHGFVTERNIVSNANAHLRCRVLLNIDLEDYFGSVKSRTLSGILQKEPFRFSQKLTQLLLQLTFYRGSLPQGAPTSPLLANLASVRLDEDLSHYAQQAGVTYTRYADDITFSTQFAVMPDTLASRVKGKTVLASSLVNLIEQHKFRINFKKVRLNTKAERKEVTGLTVTNRLNVTRRYLNQVRAMLHSLKCDGPDIALWKHLQNRSSVRHTPASFEQVLQGKIEYIGMVRGRDDKIYLSLKSQFAALRKNFKPA